MKITDILYIDTSDQEEKDSLCKSGEGSEWRGSCGHWRWAWDRSRASQVRV